ncbi:MAG: leucine-rich repeat protein [Clostridia bacterium]|nr:leucine-rich repeat protein [Clostridia bacterium]
MKKTVKLIILLAALALALTVLAACGNNNSGPSVSGKTGMRFQSFLNVGKDHLVWTPEDGLFESLPTPPVEVGYTFSHWVAGSSTEPLTLEELNEYAKGGGHGIHFYAKYTPNTDTAYKVLYYREKLDSDGFDLVETLTLSGTTGTEPVIPKRDGYEGYTERLSCDVFAINRYGESEFSVYYELPRYRVTFSTDDISALDGLSMQLIKRGGAASAPTVKKFGYKFLGFDKDLTNITEDIEVGYMWELIHYSITYDLGIGTVSGELPTTYNVEGEDIDLRTLPSPEPPDDNYRFIGWETESGVPITVLSSGLAKDIKLIAKYEYVLEIENGTVLGVTDFGRTKSTIVIPSVYEGVSVTEIASRAFAHITDNVVSVVIPESIRTIRKEAFLGMNSLKSITIPNTVTLIEDGAIYSCEGLTEVTLPYLGETRDATEKLYFCRALGGDRATFNASMLIPDTLTSITVNGGFLSEESFILLSGVTSLTLSDIAGGFSARSLEGCSSLEKFSIGGENYVYDGETVVKDGTLVMSVSENIPDTVTKIASYAFLPVTETLLAKEKITELSISSGITALENACLFGLNDLARLTVPFITDPASDISPDTGARAARLAWLFYPDDGIGALLAPDTLKSVTVLSGAICNNAFSGASVEEVTLGGEVSAIGEYAFGSSVADNNVLKSVTFESDSRVTAIGSYAFRRCKSLEQVYLPESVTSIGEYAFYGCSSLTSINIPVSVSSLGEYVFASCTSLGSVTLPGNITVIPSYAFYRCSALSGISLQNGITLIMEFAFEGSGLTSLTLPDTLTEIESYAFRAATRLKDVSWGKVRKIGNYAFADCTELNSAALPEELTTLGSDVFSGCSSLASALIPKNVREIGTWIFDGCSSLVRLDLLPGYDGTGGSLNLLPDLLGHCEMLSEIYICEGGSNTGTASGSIALDPRVFAELELSRLHIGGGVHYVASEGLRFTEDAHVTIENPSRFQFSSIDDSVPLTDFITLVGSTDEAKISEFFIKNPGVYWTK